MQNDTCLLAHNSNELSFQVPFLLEVAPSERFLCLDYSPSASYPADFVSAPLVNNQDLDSFLLHVYHSDVLVKRPSRNFKHDGGGLRTEIFYFSQQSANRLNFVARNSGHLIRSHFCLTYHEMWPSDGQEIKRQLNLFLTRCRKQFPRLDYLWCVEFQDRSAPHFHFFSSLPPHESFQYELTELWLQSIGAVWNQTTRWWHNRNQPGDSNFIPWSMGSGSYLVKEYVAKSSQKEVPEHFKNVGRFWGHSKSMKPAFLLVDPESTNHPLGGVSETILKRAIRICRKVVENRIDNHRKLSAKKQEVFDVLVGKGHSLKSAAHKVRGFRLHSLLQKIEHSSENQLGSDSATLREISPGVLASPRVAPKINLAKRIKSYSLPLATACFMAVLQATPSGSFLQLGNLAAKLL